MIVKELIEQLAQELDMEMPKINEQKAYPFVINSEITVHIRDLDPGIYLHSIITPCPKERREELYILLMKANYLGQGTGNARIGIDDDDKVLTLSHGFPYELNYQLFKESVEDFVNFVIYWKEAVAKFEWEK